MFRLFRERISADGLAGSLLYDQDTFYAKLMQDIQRAQSEIIIESPFITKSRMRQLAPVIAVARRKGVRVVVNTRPPHEHNEEYGRQAEQAVDDLQTLGVTVLYTGGHHRKLAIIDRTILWEGSLNILSQGASCEIMRRMASPGLAQQMIAFIGIEKFMR